MKLTKKENIPLLSIIISNQSRTGKVMALNQDIPVRVLGPRQMEHIHEPLVPEPQVNILMPSLMSIRSIAERMKAISNTIEVSANTNGELRLKVESELVQIVTYYKNLLNPELDVTSQVGTPRETATARDAHDFVSAKVDIRNFIKFLHSYHVAPNNVVCCIIENFAVVIHVYVNSSLTTFFGQQNCAALTYYIPVRAHLLKQADGAHDQPMAAPQDIPSDIQKNHSLDSDYFVLACHLPPNLAKATLKQRFHWNNDHVYLKQAPTGSKAWLVTSDFPKAVGLIKRFNASWWEGQCLDLSLAKPHCKSECAVSFGVKMKDVRKRHIVNFFSRFGVVVHVGLQYHDKYLMTMGVVYFDTRDAVNSMRSRRKTLVFMEKPMGVVTGTAPLGKIEDEVLQRGKAFLKQQTKAKAKSASTMPTAAPPSPPLRSASPNGLHHGKAYDAGDKELEIVFDNDDTSSFPLTSGIGVDGELVVNDRDKQSSGRLRSRNDNRDQCQSPEWPRRNSDRPPPSARFAHSLRTPRPSGHPGQRAHRHSMPAESRSPSRWPHPPRSGPKSAPFRPLPPANFSEQVPFQPPQGNLIGVPTNTPVGVIPVYQRSGSPGAPLQMASTRLPPSPQRPRVPPPPSDYFPLRRKVPSPPPPTSTASPAPPDASDQTLPASLSNLPVAEGDGDILLSGNIFTSGQAWEAASSFASAAPTSPILPKATTPLRAAAYDKDVGPDAVACPTTSAIPRTPATPTLSAAGPTSQSTSPTDTRPEAKNQLPIPLGSEALSPTAQTMQNDMASLSMAPTPASPVEETNRLLDNAAWLPYVPVVYDTFSAYHNSNHGGIYRYASIAVTSPDLDSNGTSYALSAGARLWTLTTTPTNDPAPFQARLEQYMMPPNLPRGAAFYRRADQWLDRPHTKPVHAIAPRLRQPVPLALPGLLRSAPKSGVIVASGHQDYLQVMPVPPLTGLNTMEPLRTVQLAPPTTPAMRLGRPMDVHETTVVGVNNTKHNILQWQLPAAGSKLPDVIMSSLISPSLGSPISSIAHSPFGPSVVVTSNVSIYLWDQRAPSFVVLERWAHGSSMVACALSPFREYHLLTGDTSGTVHLWDTRMMNRLAEDAMTSPVFQAKRQTEAITRLQWSRHDYSVFGSSSRDGTVTLWNPLKQTANEGLLFCHAGSYGPVSDFDILDPQYTVVSTGQGKGAGQALGHEVQIWRPNPIVFED
ncbi:Checkpoint protein hus1 [Dimargaris xerosporica]|nr:Checkpoint protein hus1 [Dimargaris xerosporica]